MGTSRNALARRRRRRSGRSNPDEERWPAGGPGVRLTPLVVRLPNHMMMTVETLWGRNFGGYGYEIHTVPRFAYGLNLGDLVEAYAEPPETVPEIRRVVCPSGHNTIRLMFTVATLREEEALLRRLNRLGVAFENGPQIPEWIALDVPPGMDMGKVLRTLDRWELQDWILYETGEERVAGSFDDDPPWPRQ